MEVERLGAGVGCHQSNMRVTIQTIASIVQACRWTVYEPYLMELERQHSKAYRWTIYEL